MSDEIDATTMALYALAISDALEGSPVPRNAAALVSVDAEPWITTRDALADHLRESGLHGVAKRVRRILVPANHVLIVVVESDVRIRVIDLRDDDGDDARDADVPRGASALSVLGMLGGSR